MKAHLLGYDIGSSSVKVSLIEADSGKLVASATSPDSELEISTPKPSWAEQDPEIWWKHAILATQKVFTSSSVKAESVLAIAEVICSWGKPSIRDGNLRRVSVLSDGVVDPPLVYSRRDEPADIRRLR